MSNHYAEKRFGHKGHKFVARFYYDRDTGEPWKEHDGHGPVSEWTRREKLPGERVLATDRGFKRYYNWQEAMHIAKRDGWDAPPYDEGTRGQRAARSVQRDFELLRGWCNDDWHWCGISVTLRNEDGDFDESREFEFALWAIESESDDYHMEVMHDLAEQALHEYHKEQETKAREQEASRPDMYQLARSLPLNTQSQ